MPQQPRQNNNNRIDVEAIANRGGRPDQLIVSPSEYEVLARAFNVQVRTGSRATFSVNGQPIAIGDAVINHSINAFPELKKGRFKGIGY